MSHYVWNLLISCTGQVRPFCISYVSADPDKVMTHFEGLLGDVTRICADLKWVACRTFSVVVLRCEAHPGRHPPGSLVGLNLRGLDVTLLDTRLLAHQLPRTHAPPRTHPQSRAHSHRATGRYGNKMLFLESLEQRRADLLYTQEILQSEGAHGAASAGALGGLGTPPLATTPRSPLRRGDGAPPRPSGADREASLAELGKRVKAVQAIIDQVEPLVQDPRMNRQIQLLEERGCSGVGARRSPLRPRKRASVARDRAGSVRSSAGGVSDYAPQFVNVNKARAFERHLKTFEQLTRPLCTPSMAKLRKMHEHYRRDIMVLGMELEEAPLLEHRSSLLTIGRCVVLNFHLTPTEDFLDVYLPPKETVGGRAKRSLTFSNTTGGRGVLEDTPADSVGVADSAETLTGGPAGSGQPWFDSDYLLSSSPTSQSIYLDALDEFYPARGPGPGAGDSALLAAETASVDSLSMRSLDLATAAASGEPADLAATLMPSPILPRSPEKTASGLGPVSPRNPLLTRVRRSLSVDSMDSLRENLTDGTPLTVGYQGSDGTAGQTVR